ncbi:MAG: phosphate propanoyltransferase [Firmicutes bacterium]|jgi:propanediol utilization protein|nr:phosphate propanoyltransferase [Bacillota bacterium]MDH7495445.1 phosphate propanoyltransferase [Bacillota bacterium]
MDHSSIEDLVAKCVRELEARGLVVPGVLGVPGVPGASGVPGVTGAFPAPPHDRPAGGAGGWAVPVGVSSRHVHLCARDFEALFGVESAKRGLEKLRDLSQPGQFAAKEMVALVGPKGSIHGVRVLGPLRSRTQIEISRTDGFALGVSPPVRDSGDVDGSVAMTLVGPAGAVNLKEGVIIATRHIHMSPRDASSWGLRDGDRVDVEVEGVRSLVFRGVLVRVREDFQLEMHVDTDEANAALLRTGDVVKVIGRSSGGNG